MGINLIIFKIIITVISLSNYFNFNIESIIRFIIRGLVIIVVGFIIVKLVNFFIKVILTRTKLDKMIVNFFVSIIKPVIYLVYFLSLLSIFGVPLTGVTAILTASGVAISLALQDSLSNIANGLMIIFSKPFKVDDYVSIGDVEGTVVDISMVITTLITFDNKKVTLPNNNVFKSNITNYTALNIRRLDLEFYVSLVEDVNKVKEALYNGVISHKLVKKDQHIMIHLKEYLDNKLVFICRMWVGTDDYWDLRWDICEVIHKEFIKNGIVIPFNQIEVKMEEKVINQ